MIEALFTGLGNIFATGVGILLLGAIAGALFVLWDWRIALLGAVFIHLGACSILVLVHDVPGLVAAGQLLAVTLAATMLAIAGFLHSDSKSLHQAGNWPLRLLALIFVVIAWWYLDPGYTLPYFSQPETDFMLWTGICALVMWSFSGSPLMAGAAVLLWSTPMYGLASVLLPGSGLPVVVGITDVILALACSYLVLLEPSGVRSAKWQNASRSVAAAVAPLKRRTREVLPPRPAAGSTMASEPMKEKAAQ